MTEEQRGGLLASSKSQLTAYGVNTSFEMTKSVQIERWFNDHPSSPLSGCQLHTPVTEFQTQGLELDLAVMCWGQDLLWQKDVGWRSSGRSPRSLKDPHQITLNAYRVLLTRAREGLVIWVPDDRVFDKTFEVLCEAGVTLI